MVFLSSKSVGLVGVGILTSLALACSGSSSSEPATPGFESLHQKLMARKVSEYRVFSVEDESGAIRVNLVLTPQPAEAAELRRLTLNALRDLQTAVGKDLRLSAWAHTEDTSAVRGMAFYSALSETYHFKDADELP